jgi:transcriptional regulator with PAS, ATPase and Fis domain
VAGIVGTHEAVYTDQEELKLDDAVNYLEYTMITNALEEYGSTYKAAEVLGITQSRIMRKMKALNITQGKSKTV